MGAIMNIIAIPLGWLLKLIDKVIPNYFGALFVFTFLIQLALFPLSLKSQKSQADRARLAPRLERLQKKYAKDPAKLRDKQMALYEKEGVSMTGGCLPMILRMVILLGVFSVIYSPISNLTDVPAEVVNASYTAMTGEGEEDPKQFSGYYKELRILQNLEKYEDDVKTEIANMEGYDAAKATEAYDTMLAKREDFRFFGTSLLNNPWGEKGFAGISLLWLIPLLSGITSLFVSFVSMHYNKQLMSGQQQPGQGCSNGMMMYGMPLFSAYIAFTVPGGVGVYWVFSNVIALIQTVVLNTIYNPAKIRAQAEVEYEERRRQKLEDKKRLAEARAREQRALAAELNEQKKPAQKKSSQQKKTALENRVELPGAMETEPTEEPEQPSQTDSVPSENDTKEG